MIFNHRYGGMSDVTLILCEARIQIFFEFGAQFPYYDGRIGDFFTIQFDKW